MRRGRAWTWVLAAVLCAGATGCRHRRVVVVPPPLPPMPAVELSDADAMAPGLIPEVPLTPSPMPKKAVVPRFRMRRKPVEPVAPVVPVPEAAPAPVPAPVPANVVGSLSTGGDAGPAAKQRAADALAAVEKRLAGLPAPSTDAHREGLVRVRNFVRQAREALDTGDADGAQTLAVKAGLLLDDLTK